MFIATFEWLQDEELPAEQEFKIKTNDPEQAFAAAFERMTELQEQYGADVYIVDLYDVGEDEHAELEVYQTFGVEDQRPDEPFEDD